MDCDRRGDPEVSFIDPMSNRTYVRKIALGADHVGVELRQHIVHHPLKQGCEVVDCGAHGPGPVDYPVFAGAVTRPVDTAQRAANVDRRTTTRDRRGAVVGIRMCYARQETVDSRGIPLPAVQVRTSSGPLRSCTGPRHPHVLYSAANMITSFLQSNRGSV